MSEEMLVTLWRRARREIDSMIEDVVSKLVEAEVLDVARYIVAGGKRLRGFTTLLVAEGLGSTWERALPAAVAVELLHSASLAVDDVVDGDVVRRGVEAAWLKYGPAKALLAANLLAAAAFKLLMDSYGVRVLRYTTLAWLDITRGEVRDAYTKSSDYLSIIRLKTGSLFRLAAELGGVAAGVSEERIRVLSEYGELLGIAYQLADDAVDWIVRGESDESAVRLVRWVGVEDKRALVERVVAKIRELLSKADELVRSLLGTSSRLLPLLTSLPRFAVRLMFAEAGINLVL